MKCLEEEEPKTCAFDKESTYLNDYRWCVPDKRIRHTWPKDRCPSPPKVRRKGYFRPPEKYKDSQTLYHWREGAKVPFYLYWEPKESVNSDPTKIIDVPSKQKEEFEEREAKEKQKAIKTRPRLYISPAVSMDDIEDPEVRKTLVDFTYITDWEKNCRESCLPSSKVEVVPNVFAYLDQKMDLQVETLPKIPTHLRKSAKEWDSKQTRACVDPSEVFWRRQEPQPPKRDLIGALVPNEIREEIKQLVETNNLRKEHDRLSPSYDGHRSFMNPGLPLKSNEFPVVHPMVSVMQANTIRHGNKKDCL